MLTGPISIRPARPDIEEGMSFAHYLDTAADGTFRILLGRRFADIIARAYISPNHDLSHEHVVFAERGGVVVGMLSAYTAAQHRESTDEPLEEAAGARMVRMAALMRLGRGVLGFMDQIPDGDFYIQAVAVDETGRGSGIGSKLLDQAEATAATAGCQRVCLDVAASNKAARRLYERRGMTLEATSPSILFMPRTSAHRMVKSIREDVRF